MRILTWITTTFGCLLTCLICVVIPLPVAMAQNTPALVRRVAPDYSLGAGDQINIRVVDLDELSDKTVRLDPDGNIDLPLTGSVHAAGKSINQLRKELYASLSKYIGNPEVTINLVTNVSSKVSVLGEVNAPGTREIVGPTNLIETISNAGGLRVDAGSKAIITRSLQWGELPLPNQKHDSTGQFSIATLSIDDLMSAKNPTDNIMVRPGDVISIPKAMIVYVVGGVRRAGGFPLSTHNSMSALQALSLAEGLAPNSSSNDAKILRPNPDGEGKPTEIPINIRQIFSGKAPDPPLYAEDILYVPSSAAKAGMKRAAEVVLQVAAGVAIYR